MRSFALCIAAAAGSTAELVRPAPPELMEWGEYKLYFAKSYDPDEEPDRAAAFASNVEVIKRVNAEHDAGISSVRLGVNDFADLTNEEFRRLNRYTQAAETSHARAHLSRTRFLLFCANSILKTTETDTEPLSDLGGAAHVQAAQHDRARCCDDCARPSRPCRHD